MKIQILMIIKELFATIAFYGFQTDKNVASSYDGQVAEQNSCKSG